MTRRGTLAARVVVIAGTAFIGACSEPAHDKNEHYVFVATNINLPYWKEAEAGFLDGAKTLGVTAELTGPATYSPNAELQAFRQAVEQQPAGICLSAARPELFQADIDKAVAQGIPVICVDSDVPNSKRLTYIGTDNFKAGRESLRRMAALVQSKGNIAVITIEGQRNLDDRVAGVADALANFPALKLTKILDGKGDAKSAFDQVSDLIQKKENIAGIICLEATGGAGAADAVHRFNMEGKLPIVAFDNDPETLNWIDKGAIAVTITQKP
ncbi:MAG TPA: substrate-binding domain-containing protein, partial [Terriglobales bacterium]|nr:substrate-binding domain-containing protein [Terriglobales bacterium]